MIARLRRVFTQERVTLLIEEETARLLTVHTGRVVRWGSAPIARGAIVDGRIVEAGAVAAAVTRLWELHGPPREAVILGVPGVGVATRLLPAPRQARLTEEEVLEAAARSLDIDGTYLAWQLVGPPARRAVYVVAMPAPALDAYLAVLDRLQIVPVAVDLKPLALIRAVGHRHAVVADLERALLTILIVDEAIPRLARVRPLVAPLLVHPDEKVTRLAETLGAAIEDYNGESNGRLLHPAVPVYLTGALADQPLLREVVQLALSRPAVLPSPPVAVPPDLPVTQYLANMGLALKRL